MADTRFADISEWQSSFDADAYLKGGHKVVIVRAHSGYKPDKMMPARRDYVRSKPFDSVGYYIYLAKDRDAAQQAREFISVIGQLRGNEFAALDLEEGAGNQVPRAEAFFKVTDPWAKMLTTLYSGSSMLNSQLGGTARWGKRPLWIAAYPGSYTPNPAVEPKGATWWQYSDRERFPGLSGAVDGNIFHGTAAEHCAAARGGAAAPAPAPAPKPASSALASVVKPNGAIEVFEETASGEVLHKWQTKENGGWVKSWQSLGKP